MVRLLSIYFVCLVIVSCSSRHSATVNDEAGAVFADSIDVQWTYIAGDDMMPSVTDFIAGDTCLYLLGNAGGQWVHIYDAKTGSEIGSRVDRLSQIGELKDASHLSVDCESGDFGIFNQGMRERSLFRYSRDFDAICMYCLDSMFIVNDMRLIAPGCIVALSLVWENGNATGRQAINIIDVTDGIKVIDTFDDSSASIPKGLMQNLYVSPSGKKIARITPSGGILETYEIIDDCIKRISANDYFPLKVSDDGIAMIDHKSRYGFGHAAVTDDYIYIAFSESHVEGDPVTKVGIWDWNGKPVKKINTDKSVRHMAVAPDGCKLYCISYDQGARYAINYIDLSGI